MDVKARIAHEIVPRLAMLDADGTIIAANAAWADHASANGTSPDVSAVGENYLSILDAVDDNDRPAAAAAAQGIRDVIAGGQSEYRQDFPYLTPAEEKLSTMHVSALTGINGLQVSILYEEIPAPKTLQQDLDQAQSRLNAILDSIDQAIIIIDRKRRIRVHNEFAKRNALAVFDRPLQNGDPIDLYVLPPDQAGFDKHFAAAMTGERIKTALKFEGTDGNPHWFEFTYAPVYEGEGEITGVFFGTVDATEKNLAEIALRNSEELFRAIVEDSLDGITVTDTQGRLLLWNPAAERITGIPAASALGPIYLGCPVHAGQAGQRGSGFLRC